MPSLAEHAQRIAAAYTPPSTGRPSDIGSPSTITEFLQAIGEGNYIETAAKLSGLSKQAVYNWIKRGEQGEEPFAAFVDALQKAEARAEAAMVRNVRQASELPQYWAAAATHLERRHPDRWGKRQDDASVPKVVVQIGVSQGEVKVGIINPTFAPPTSTDSLCISGLSGDCESNNNELCKPANALSVNELAPASEAIGESVRANPEGDPTGVAVAVGGQGSHAQGKGRPRSRKKKGLA